MKVLLVSECFAELIQIRVLLLAIKKPVVESIGDSLVQNNVGRKVLTIK